MDKQTFKDFIGNVKRGIIKHSPEMLVGIGIAGMITSTVLAVKATPKAMKIIEARKKEEKVEELSKTEVVKTVWKCYIPSAVTCVLSATCLICANSVHSKRNTAAIAAYKLSEKALAEYKDAVIETIGEKKEKAVKDKVAEKNLEKNPVSKSEVIFTDKGNTLCYESIGGRYFRSDIDTIKRVENVLNRQMLSNDYVSLNDFYDEIGLKQTDLGRELGWSVSDGLIEFYFSSQLADDGTPCLVIDYSNPPKHGFDMFS